MHRSSNLGFCRALSALCAIATFAAVAEPAEAQSSRIYESRRSVVYLRPMVRPTDFYRAPQAYFTAPSAKPPLKQAESKESRAPEVEKRPAGQLHVVISIPHQRLSLYANGVRVATSPVSTGQSGFPTPKGIFSIIQKARFHHSNIYSGAPMPFMQRVTWSGVALHAGVLPGYPASHGCIRLPHEFAQRLFGITKLAARVIIAADDVAPVEIEHATLTALKVKVGAPVEPPKIVLLKVPAQTSDLPLDRVPIPVEIAKETNVEATAVPLVTATPAETPHPELKAPPLRTEPIAIFISRKLGRIYVRQGFAPLFDGPVVIKDRDRPIGTHVFTAMEPIENASRMRWTAITLPGETLQAAEEQQRPRTRRFRGERLEAVAVQAPRLIRVEVSALEALDRVEIAPEVAEELSEFMREGSSIILTDHGLGPETGKGTDFIVVTR